jgi:ATP/maltotriose-dependent transcriptional regulator MalT
MSETPPSGHGDTAGETWHLSAELFRRFLEQRVSPPERRAVMRHLVTQCPECFALAERITAEAGYWTGEAGAEARVDRDYTEAFQAAFKFATQGARRLAVERLRGWAHWSALDLLDPVAVGGVAAASDMRARAWVVLADCRRLAADLDGARAAIAEAWRWNDEGVGDPLDKARIYVSDASYAAMIGEFETAVVILKKALLLYRGADDPHLEGRTLVQMARTIGYAYPDRGIAHLEEALNLITPVREPRLALCAEHFLAEFLCAADRPAEAFAILDRVRPLYRQFPDEWAQLRLHWLQGRIIHGLGDFSEAADILRQVQEEFRGRDLRQDFLLVSIDLAEAHVALGETATALRLASEVTPLLASWKPHRSAMDAWLLFQKTLEEGRDLDGAALAPFLGKLRLYYRLYWFVPGAAE